MFAGLTDSPYLLVLRTLLPNYSRTGQICLVGGAVRDTLLGRPFADFDFTSPGDPTSLARTLAGKVAGHWFWLDEKRRQSRVISEHGSADFAPWRAETLELDLAARDFTINAMALDLAEETGVALIDPLGGRADLVAGILRCAGHGVLIDDPLRVLKGIRHMAELGLHLDPMTHQAMRDAAPALADVTPERIRVEFWRILAARDATAGLTRLIELGVGNSLFGEHGPVEDAVDICRAAQSAAAALRDMVAAVPETASRLAEEVEQGLTREQLLLWHEVTSRIDAGLPLQLARAWRCGGQTVRRMAALTESNPSCCELSAVPCRTRPLAMWALQHGPDPRDIFYRRWIRNPEEPGLKAIIQVVEQSDRLEIWPPLVDGHWLAAELGLNGPGIGRALALLRDAEIRGEVSDSVQAKNFLASSLSNCS